MQNVIKNKLKTWACLLAIIAVLAIVGCGGQKQDAMANAPCSCTVAKNNTDKNTEITQ